MKVVIVFLSSLAGTSVGIVLSNIIIVHYYSYVFTA